MTKITKEELIKLARISNLELPAEEIDSLLADLEAVLTYAAGLKEAAEKYEGYKLHKNQNIFREDTIIATDPEPLRSLAPEREEDFYVVPKVIK